MYAYDVILNFFICLAFTRSLIKSIIKKSTFLTLKDLFWIICIFWFCVCRLSEILDFSVGRFFKALLFSRFLFRAINYAQFLFLDLFLLNFAQFWMHMTLWVFKFYSALTRILIKIDFLKKVFVLTLKTISWIC